MRSTVNQSQTPSRPAAVLLLLPVLMTPEYDNSSEAFTAIVYPVADIILLASVSVALLATTRRNGPAMTLVVLASTTWLVSDTIWSYQTIRGNGDYAAILDFGWPLFAALIAIAAWSPASEWVARETLKRRAGFLSGAGVLFALAVLLVRGYSDSEETAGVLLAAAAVAGGGLRLALSHRESNQLLDAANTDHLTGIPSRAKLSADFSNLGGRSTTVMMIDLDGFKLYNDDFGHPAGDALLKEIAGNLEHAAKPGGRAYRVGGDEFCVLLPRDSATNQAKIESVREATEITGEGFDIRASVGYSDYPGEVDDARKALAIADERMYSNKNLSRTSPRRQVRDVLLSSLEAREPELAKHTKRVSELAVAVAREISTEQDDHELIERAAELHDVGKSATPDSILYKPGKLEPDEWEQMKQHSAIGERIISTSPSLAPIAKLVRHSHEHWNGDGYPDRLEGTEIPLGSRIILVCDALEVMLSGSPYSQAVDLDQALHELERCAGHQFDPNVVDVLLRLVREGQVDPMPDHEQV